MERIYLLDEFGDDFVKSGQKDVIDNLIVQ